MSEITMWEIEDAQDCEIICGVDEAGRGPLAGPVCAAAVILPKHLQIPGLTDSKKLSDKKRRELFPLIQEQVVTQHGWLSRSEFTDLITISQMTPGPIAVNSATFVGIRLAGFLGALAATFGCILRNPGSLCGSAPVWPLSHPPEVLPEEILWGKII